MGTLFLYTFFVFDKLKMALVYIDIANGISYWRSSRRKSGFMVKRADCKKLFARPSPDVLMMRLRLRKAVASGVFRLIVPGIKISEGQSTAFASSLWEVMAFWRASGDKHPNALRNTASYCHSRSHLSLTLGTWMQVCMFS